MPQHGKTHIHKRGRVCKKGQKRSHPDLKIRVIDDLCVVFAVLMPATALPQIYKTFHTQDATGVSLWMWVLYSIGVVPFLLYGMAHRVRHLVILNLLWLSVQLTMIIGVLLYG